MLMFSTLNIFLR